MKKLKKHPGKDFLYRVQTDESIISITLNGVPIDYFCVDVNRDTPINITMNPSGIIIENMWALYFINERAEELFIEQLFFVLEENIEIDETNRITKSNKIVHENELNLKKEK